MENTKHPEYQTRKFTHNGYVLWQTEFNNHFYISDEKGDFCVHAAYNTPIRDEKQAAELIDFFISFQKPIADGTIEERLKENRMPSTGPSENP